MPAGSLLTLLDDIASILDDVSILTKKAAAKTAGVLGDDLALNAQQVSGVVSQTRAAGRLGGGQGIVRQQADPRPAGIAHRHLRALGHRPAVDDRRSLPVFRRLRKTRPSFPPSEGKSAEDAGREIAELAATSPRKKWRRRRIKSKARCARILCSPRKSSPSPSARWPGRISPARCWCSRPSRMVMTVGVYGLVAGIVKLDDAGLYLTQRRGALCQQRLGRAILWAAPFLMKTLSVLGTAAMFLVGGGIRHPRHPVASPWHRSRRGSPPACRRYRCHAGARRPDPAQWSLRSHCGFRFRLVLVIVFRSSETWIRGSLMITTGKPTRPIDFHLRATLAFRQIIP